jgi:hypothetical protein
MKEKYRHFESNLLFGNKTSFVSHILSCFIVFVYFTCQSRSMSSSDLPVVSGTSFHVM